MTQLLLKLHGSMSTYYSESLQLGGTLKLLLEDDSSRLRLLSSLGALYQQLLDMAHMVLLSRGLHAARVLG
jgi:hypothetical protein